MVEPNIQQNIVYVTDDLDKFYLSCLACTDLRMILPTFPTIGEDYTTPDLISWIWTNLLIHNQTKPKLTQSQRLLSCL